MMIRASLVEICIAIVATLAAPTAMAVEQSDPLWQIPLDSLNQTRNKPLFSPTRRPPPPPPSAPIAVAAPAPVAPPVEAVEEPPPKATLVGVIMGPEGFSVAMLLDDNSTSPRRVQVGETFKNWKLTEVSRRAAVLQRDARSVTIALKTPSATARAPFTPAQPGGMPMVMPTAGPNGQAPFPMMPVPNGRRP